MIYNNSFVRPGDSHIINLTNSQLTPGVFDPSGNKVSLHIDNENRLYYQIIQNGLTKNVYIESYNSPTISTSEEYTSLVEVGCIKKGQTIQKGTTIDSLVKSLLLNADLTPVQPSGKIQFTGIGDSLNHIEVGSPSIKVSHRLAIEFPKFIDNNGNSFPISEFKYSIIDKTSSPIRVNTQVESIIPVSYTFKLDKEIKASDMGLSIDIGNGSSLPSTSVIVPKEITITDYILVSYKWCLAKLTGITSSSDITYSRIMNSNNLQSGWINQSSSTIISDRIQLNPGECIVVMVPNKENIGFTSNLLNQPFVWELDNYLYGNSDMKIYYLISLPTGNTTEYTQLKITR